MTNRRRIARPSHEEHVHGAKGEKRVHSFASKYEGGVIDPSLITKTLGSPPLLRGEKGFKPLFRSLVSELQPATFSQGVLVYEIAYVTLLSRRFRRADAGLLEDYSTASLTNYEGDPDLPDFVRATDQEPPKREVVRPSTIVSIRRKTATSQSLGAMLVKNIDVIERNHALMAKMDQRRDGLIEALRQEQRSTSNDHPTLDLNAVEL